MTVFAAIPDWVALAPVAFGVGVVVGLALASRYRIIRVRNQEEEERHD